MAWWIWAVVAIGAVLGVVTIVGLRAQRSRDALVQIARLVPPCLDLLRDIIRDPAVPRRAKLAPALVIAYLAVPIDVIPDFIPGLGQLDDAIVVAWAVRHVVASAGRERVAGHWKGDDAGLARVLRLAGVR